ncbi:hypothetical protein [Natrinema sp. 1APR25-10V2]|uniref:hypothetical protein n=1 Tax=Natrinema sp. 1APR25-10V2 TaxID=2951081 RepID=UPI0028768982|nr:hypothetical protein [Natrinema sp. 1APR25-10V2]MDS0475821.1 hypothetical protein [Natrinema sp. 1APR25-10V2]
MPLRNRHGVPVDPVPFVVVVGLAFMILLSFGPLYGQALGLSLEAGIAASVALFLVALTVAFHRQVWNADPEALVPAALRAERLFYLIPILTALIVALAVPLLVG